MATKISKKKISSYQKLKAKKEELELILETIIERPHSSQAKNYRLDYKIQKDLLWWQEYY